MAEHDRRDLRVPVPVAVDVAAKVGLLVLLAIAVAFPDLGGVRGKAAGLRAVAYPLGAFVVPLVWALWLRQRRPAYPWWGDTLITLPWFLDTLGNRLDLFDTIAWFDDAMHYLNWGLLTAGFLVLTTRTPALPPLIERALAFGVTTALGWELAEYVAFIRHSPELATAYTDTLGDMTLGTCGALTAAVLVAAVRRPAAASAHP
ncbi:MAG: hypothetical protein ACR2K2_02850 [Mycobacteriales bacterium]